MNKNKINYTLWSVAPPMIWQVLCLVALLLNSFAFKGFSPSAYTVINYFELAIQLSFIVSCVLFFKRRQRLSETAETITFFDMLIAFVCAVLFYVLLMFGLTTVLGYMGGENGWLTENLVPCIFKFISVSLSLYTMTKICCERQRTNKRTYQLNMVGKVLMPVWAIGYFVIKLAVLELPKIM